jgi:transposase
MEDEAFAVVVGVDVGKTMHHAVALDRDGVPLQDQAVANDEGQLRALLGPLRAHGAILLVVDQPQTIGALPVAVAQAMGVTVGYLPGLTMRRIADTYAGHAKTDRRDATIIADTARTRSDLIRAVVPLEPHQADLKVLCGYDADLAHDGTMLANRIQGVLTQIHPALARVLGPRLDQHGVLALLAQWPTPRQLRQAGERRITACLRRQDSRRAAALARDIIQALGEQAVVVDGTEAAGQVLTGLAAQLAIVQQQRATTGARIEALVAPDPLYPVLTSLVGVGVRTAATFLVETAGKEFASAADLASYAGLCPVTWRSGTSIARDRPARHGNTRLKHALFQSAFASLRHAPSRTYYDRKRNEGKTHNQALLALARRRTDVLYAMIRDGTLYQDPTTAAA